MNQRALVDRLLSPAGFGLVLLFFLFPFVSVSCSANEESVDEGSVVATFTGIDMVVGGEPDLTAPGTDQEAREAQQALVAIFHDRLDLEPLALLAAVTVLAGMLAALIRERLARHAVGVGIAVLAIALLSSAQARVFARLDEAMRATLEPGDPSLGVIANRYGLWLAVAVLAALVVGHMVALVRAWAAPPAPPPAADPDGADVDPPDVEVRAEYRT